MIGIATIICEITSGGVIAADKINTPTIACFLYFFKKAGVTIPKRVKIYEITGNKNNIPE